MAGDADVAMALKAAAKRSHVVWRLTIACLDHRTLSGGNIGGL